MTKSAESTTSDGTEPNGSTGSAPAATSSGSLSAVSPPSRSRGSSDVRGVVWPTCSLVAFTQWQLSQMGLPPAWRAGLTVGLCAAAILPLPVLKELVAGLMPPVVKRIFGGAK